MNTLSAKNLNCWAEDALGSWHSIANKIAKYALEHLEFELSPNIHTFEIEIKNVKYFSPISYHYL
jgi:hypothetical protein